jgi:hypothetical protein
VLGAAIIVFVIVVMLPVVYLLSGAVASAIVGWALWKHAEIEHEGSELIDLNY